MSETTLPDLLERSLLCRAVSNAYRTAALAVALGNVTTCEGAYALVRSTAVRVAGGREVPGDVLAALVTGGRMGLAGLPLVAELLTGDLRWAVAATELESEYHTPLTESE